jgi:hypothetical protein
MTFEVLRQPGDTVDALHIVRPETGWSRLIAAATRTNQRVYYG